MACLSVLGDRRRLAFKRRSAPDGRAAALHELLDKALAEGVQPIELESSIGDLLNMARRRGHREQIRRPRGPDAPDSG